MPLRDYLIADLKLVICGTAAGNQSAREGKYYSHPTNSFWPTLFTVGLIDKPLGPGQETDLLHYGIGLTDLVKHISGNDDTLKRDDFDVKSFQYKMEEFSPRTICFNGKKAAKIALGIKDVQFGFQQSERYACRLFVAPNTADTAKKWWDIQKWQDLADVVSSLTDQ